MAGFEPHVFITDVLLFAVVGAVALAARRAWRDPHWRGTLRAVCSDRRAAWGLVVLAPYLAVTLLDSLHLSPQVGEQDGEPVYSTRVLSVLDLALTGLRERRESTYSAPLAVRSFSKETVERDGVATKGYPRLAHGGAHLEDEGGRLADVALRGALGAGAGAAAWLAMVVAGSALLARRRTGVAAALRCGLGSPGALRTALVTALAILAVGGAVAALGARYHVLGTDKVGQDILYLTLKNFRTGISIGLLTTIALLPLAVLLGIAAGYFRGKADDIIQYAYITLNSIPGVLLIAAAILTLTIFFDANPDLFESNERRADLRLVCLCLILGLTSWTGLCRLLRAETLKVSEMEYVHAAHALGVRPFTVMVRHIFPNVAHLVLIATVMDFSGLVLAEAVLSYIGIGVDPTSNSFGLMINAARQELSRTPAVWWPLASAFVFMSLLVLAVNFIADAVRDVLDPRLAKAA